MLWTVNNINSATMIDLCASISREYDEFNCSPGPFMFIFTWGTTKRINKVLTNKDLRGLLRRLVAHDENNPLRSDQRQQRLWRVTPIAKGVLEATRSLYLFHSQPYSRFTLSGYFPTHAGILH